MVQGAVWQLPLGSWVGWSTTVAFLFDLPSSSLTPDFHPSALPKSHWWQALRDSGVESDLSRVEKFVESFKDVGLDIDDEAQKEIRETLEGAGVQLEEPVPPIPRTPCIMSAIALARVLSVSVPASTHSAGGKLDLRPVRP